MYVVSYNINTSLYIIIMLLLTKLTYLQCKNFFYTTHLLTKYKLANVYHNKIILNYKYINMRTTNLTIHLSISTSRRVITSLSK